MFFERADYLIYLHWLREYSHRYGVQVLAYALMPNHVHLVVVPDGSNSLHLALRSLHARYAQRVNRHRSWVGHLWQGRYFASVLDEAYFWSAVRYVERNPVRARLAGSAEAYEWSSAEAHCGMRHDPVLTDSPRWQRLLGGVANWSGWLAEADDQQTLNDLRRQTMKGLPCGSSDFIRQLEIRSGKVLVPGRPGRPARP